MKHISVYFLFFCLLSNFVYSQDTITVYYDEDWKEISDINEASYYRKAFRDSNKVLVAHDYYISNKIQMIGSFKSKKFKVKHGHFIYYYETGKLKNKEYYNNGLLYSAEGYFENGNIRYSGKYLHGKRQGIWTNWNSEGRIILKGNFKNGMKDGEWIRHFRDSNMKIYYNNGVIEGKQPGGIVRRE